MKDRNISVGMVSLGCAKNRVDAEIMLGLLEKGGYRITGSPDEADVICINTCGFIDSAKQEAIDSIIEMSAYKEKGSCRGIIVTGCLSERYAEEIAEQLPEADAIIGIGGYSKICEAVEAVLNGAKTVITDDEKTPCTAVRSSDSLRYFFKRTDYTLSYLNSGRVLTTPGSYAYLKIAEGCDNKCAYCAIPNIRGPFRSRQLEELLCEARELARRGVKELAVVAQDTTRYGTDISGDGNSLLPELIAGLDDIDGIYCVRLLYLYPDEITEEIITAIKNSKKTAHYLDLPMQHISDNVLGRMNRRGGGKLIRNVIERFRSELPDCVIRTSLIVGFPGETEEDYKELRSFLEEARLDRVGIFKYSKEEGTEAAAMSPQISRSVKQRRYDALMTLQQKISLEKNILRVGKIYDVIVDGFSEDGLFYKGRSYAEAPETDGVIYFAAKEELTEGDVVKVKILVADEYDLTGEQL